jgi:hypothetical protein
VLAALAQPLVNALSTEFVDRVLTSRTQKPSPLPERASDLVLWWRGRDLNPRPSGYERPGQGVALSALVGPHRRKAWSDAITDARAPGLVGVSRR